MDLVIEYLPDNHVSLCHYGEQHGDLMRDPEVCFRIDHVKGTAVPYYYRNDYIGTETMVPAGRYSPGLDRFVETWFKNLRYQGHLSQVKKAA